MRVPRLSVLLLLGFLAARFLAAGTVQVLEPGKPVRRELMPRDTHEYRIPMKKGQFLHLSVDQRGIDVVLSITPPDRPPKPSIDTPNGDRAPETGSLISEAGGDCLVSIRARHAFSPSGIYTLTIDELRPATDVDRDRVAGEEALHSADALRAEGSGDSLRRAAEGYEQALLFLRRAGDQRTEALALKDLGWTAYLQLDLKKALDILEQAAALAHTAGDLYTEASALNGTAAVYFVRGNTALALTYYENSRRLRQELGDRAGELVTIANIAGVENRRGNVPRAKELYLDAARSAEALGNPFAGGAISNALGVIYEQMADFPKALEFYAKSLELRHSIGDRRGEAETVRNLGLYSATVGQNDKALEYFERALSLARSAGDPAAEVGTLAQIGLIHLRRSDAHGAIRAARDAAAVLKTLGYPAAEAAALAQVGAIYSAFGEPQKAVEPFHRVLELSRSSGDRRLEAAALSALGALYGEFLGEEGDREKALEYFAGVIEIVRSFRDRALEARALSNIGRVYANQGLLETALRYYEESLACETGERDTFITLDDIGQVYASLGQPERSIPLLTKALSQSRAAHNGPWEATTLSDLAAAQRDLGDLEAARKSIEQALEIVESVRARLVESGLRSSYFATLRHHYERYVEILMRLHERHPTDGFDGLALQASERARARGFLDALNEARWDPREGADAKLVDQERMLRQKIVAKTLSTAQTRSVQIRPGTETVPSDVSKLLDDYEHLEAEIRSSNPRYANLTRPPILAVSEIAATLLDPDTVLLEYFLGEERSFVWAVSPEGLSTYDLPGKQQIEKLAREAFHAVSTLAQSDSSRFADGSPLTLLGRLLLGPIAGQFPGKRFVIVADGALAYVPFGALIEPRLGKTNPELLALGHEIVEIPSASVLAILRAEAVRRPAGQRLLAVVADPVFTRDDPRLPPTSRVARPGQGQAEATKVQTDLTRALSDIGGKENPGPIARLPFTRREADSIAALVRPNERLEALDFEANRDLVVNGAISDYRFVHFATHGVLNSVHPELSGIVLSLLDRDGHDVLGYLTAMEVFHLRLTADMVVLSACQTALGKETRGEGLVGLTRAFMYAGTPRVVASLWRVDDAATAELMKRFYEGMLGPRKLRPAAALRDAQLAVAKQKRWRDPYYWAAFVLQGEWN